ncbi:MAG: Ribonuclease P protein component 3 [Candidatus Bathyarchaeota archaeon B26-2]|nr:MAG: Ribonuclease P protein component 3 [Candidatus Bathyarchaeota archaeon B26-2]
MKRVYADLHLKPPSIDDPEATKALIREAARLGYSLIGVTLPKDVKAEEVEKLKETCKSEGVDLAIRVDLSPKNSRDLLEELRRVRRRFEIVAVECGNKQIARQAAKDRRVDILSFKSPEPRGRFFDAAEAELASGALSALEIDLAPLLVLSGFLRVRLLSILRREVFLAGKFGVPVVLSSGASERLLLRKPRECIALARLFDMDFEAAKSALSETPLSIVERNRKKLSPNYVAPGVYVVRRGGDCPDT